MQKEQLREAFKQFVKGQLPPPNLVWATVKEVDWSNKTMTATGLMDGLEYYNVELSIDGSIYDVKEPKIGTKCILGILENKGTEAFMVWCEEFTQWQLNGDTKGGIVLAPETAQRLNNIENKLNELMTILSAWAPVATDGGAALKAALATWMSQQLSLTQQGDIESKTVKHGG